jgi:hypothetical protein
MKDLVETLEKQANDIDKLANDIFDVRDQVDATKK